MTGKSDRQNDNNIHHSETSRRSFLIAGATISLAGAGAACGQVEEETRSIKSAEKALDDSVVAQCEKMLDLAYDDDERTQILAGMEDQLEAIQAIRGIRLENGDAPACSFDPRLPGSEFAAQKGGVTNISATKAPVPESAEDIAFAPVHKQAAWIRSGKLSSSELTNIYLERIERLGPKLKNYVTVTADLARKQAARADADLASGTYRGPLHGIPYGLKDLIDTKDIKTTWGATPYQDRVAEGDATVVKLLEESGAVLLGKTTCGAIAYGDIWFDGVTRNPWHLDEGSSGSSAGSASATAAGLCSFSIGTETLGSIVSPSHRCGTTGLRPTFGRVSRQGAMALCWSLDKIGPICRSVEDTALVLAAINGPDQQDPGSIAHGFEWDANRPIDGLRIGYVPDWFANGNEVDRAALDAARTLPVELVKLDLPDWPYNTLLPWLEAEAAAAFQELTISNKDDSLVWQEDAAWPNTWRRAHFLSAVDMFQIDRFRRRVMKMMNDKFQQVDAIIGPNYAGGMLVITNYTGHPSLTLRAGFTSRKPNLAYGTPSPEKEQEIRAPHNISLWAPLFEERTLLSLGQALEKKLKVSNERPSLS